jgi:excisionase family DNA binding protein
MNFDKLLDTQQAASLLGIHAKTLQRLARNGEIPGIQIGKLWRFRTSDLDNWISKKVTFEHHPCR